MIVCLCHRVSDSQLQRAVAAGVRSFDALQDETRVASACACCHDTAREVFEAALAACGGGRGCPCGIACVAEAVPA